MEKNIFSSEKKLAFYLKKFGIKTENWGKGSAKNVGNLFKEISRRESILCEKNGRIVREIRVAGINVVFQKGKNHYRLHEDRQEFTDGRIRKRIIANSLAEKFKGDESPKKAAKRALNEELGIDEKTDIRKTGKRIEIRDSLSYPGLKTRYIIYEFTVHLSPEQFSISGYTEHEKDLTVYFKWKKQ